MFDIDTGKLLIVAVLALIVIGPKDLPGVMRQVGQAIGKLRRMSAEFQGQFMDAIKDAEIDDIRRELKDLEKNTHFDPARDIHAQMTGIKSEVESAVQSVGAEVSVASPTQGFELPAIPDAIREAADLDDAAVSTLSSDGIAPALESASETTLAAPPPADRPKRKLFIKPHRSSFARLNSDRTAELTGQAIAVRQRVVRVKTSLPHDALSS